MTRRLLASVLLLSAASASAWAETAPAAGRMVTAAQDSGVRLTLSASAVRELLHQNNSYKEDLTIQLVPEARAETGDILKAYRVVVTKTSTGEEVPYFAFSSPVELQLGYWSLLGRSSTPNAVNAWAPISDLRTVLAAYWHNGREFIRLQELTQNADKSISLTIRNTGRYEIRGVAAPASFKLVQGSPYPRVISPNAVRNRRVFFFFENPSPVEVTGTIYDFQGAKVRELRVNGQSPTANSLVWDGRDDNGQVVPTGPYLYKIAAGQDTLTGGLAVAR